MPRYRNESFKVQKLSREFLAGCPVEGGFRMRGMAMTRVEVFVDAAFAFAVTLLVISFDAIPHTYPEMVIAFKTIPAFVAAVAQLVWLWHTHATWCRRYGLDDDPTVWLSALLLVVVLIYIYPMRVLLEGFFAWISDGYFPSSFDLNTYDELRFMFAFMGIAFAALCLTFVLMYGYAVRLAAPLALNARELTKTREMRAIWAGCLVLGLVLAVTAFLVPENWVPFAGFIMALIGAWIAIVERKYRHLAKTPKETQ